MGVSLSNSDNKTCVVCKTPECRILKMLNNLLLEKNEGVYVNGEVVGKLKKLLKKSDMLNHKCGTEEKLAINCQEPALGSVMNTKKLRKVIPVEVFDPTPSEATIEFFTAFRQMLNTYGIITEKISKFSERKAPIIVICNMASRLEADIDRTFSSVRKTDHSRVVLIALHVKPKHALPQEGTKEKLSFYEDEYRDLRGVVDIAFTREDGFYNCQMNDDAVSEIRRHIAETT